MSAQPLQLLKRLESLGITLTLDAGGDGLTVKSQERPPADLMLEMKAAKPELLALLKAAARPPTSPAALLPVAEPLPAHLADLLDLAHAGQLPKGAVKLSSGLVTDLAGYVIAWAECWPRDRVHILWRLEEAYAACPSAEVPHV